MCEARLRHASTLAFGSPESRTPSKRLLRSPTPVKLTPLPAESPPSKISKSPAPSTRSPTPIRFGDRLSGTPCKMRLLSSPPPRFGADTPPRMIASSPVPSRFPADLPCRHRHSSTPELPPMPTLQPGLAPVPRVPRASPGRRFSDSEKLAFGRRACWNGSRNGMTSTSSRASIASKCNRSLCSSAEASTAAPSTTAPSIAESSANSVYESSAAGSKVASPRPQGPNLDFDMGQVKRVLDCLLPVDGSAWSPPPAIDNDRGSGQCTPVGDDGSEHGETASCCSSHLQPDDAQNCSTAAENKASTTDRVLTESNPFGSLPPLPVTPLQKPAEKVPIAATPLRPFGELSTPGGSTPGLNTTCRRSSPGKSAQTPGSGPFLPHQIPNSPGTVLQRRSRRLTLQNLRRRLLEQFRSVHDALSRLEASYPQERGLASRDFRLALCRLGIEEAFIDEVFNVMNSGSAAKVSLAELRNALVEDSPESLLWELRCRLFSVGIQPRCTSQAIHKVMDLVEQNSDLISSAEYRIGRTTQRLRRAKQKRRRQSCGARYVATASGAASAGDICDAVASEPEVSVSAQLDSDQWQRLCSALSLTLFERDALFTVLGGDDVGKIDLRGMMVVLRATVAPDVSLERFVTRLLARYGTIRCAFEAVCAEQPDRLMRWPEFHTLAQSLEVNDRNARNLWDVLCEQSQDETWPSTPGFGSETPACSSTATPAGSAVTSPTNSSSAKAISEDRFEQQLLVWSPGTALDALRDQLCDKFGSLAQSRRSLQRTAKQLQRAGNGCWAFDGFTHPGQASLTPAALQTLLQACGIDCPNADRVIGAAAVVQDRGVTLDSLFEVLRATQQRPEKSMRTPPDTIAETTCRDDTFPLWKRLHDVQADLALPWDRDENAVSMTLTHAALKAANSQNGCDSPSSLAACRSISDLRSNAADSIANRSRGGRANPFTPLYQAVASAVRSVSRRRPWSATPHNVDSMVRQCPPRNASPREQDEECNNDDPLEFQARNIRTKARSRERGKENISIRSIAKHKAITETRQLGAILQPRAGLQLRHH